MLKRNVWHIHLGKNLCILYLEWSENLSLPFKFSLEHAIRIFQENEKVLEWSGKYQILFYANDVNLTENLKTIKTKPLLQGRRRFCLEINTVKTKYMAVSRHQMQGKITIY
jgi:hypothetical protein